MAPGRRVKVELDAGSGDIPCDVLAPGKEMIVVMIERVRLHQPLADSYPFNRKHPSIERHRMLAQHVSMRIHIAHQLRRGAWVHTLVHVCLDHLEDFLAGYAAPDGTVRGEKCKIPRDDV